MTLFALLAILGGSSIYGAEADVLIADFEGDDYGDWKVEGEAFGPGPARGTLPGQMHVSGFQGKGLVNTFYKGDGTTGKLTSPPIPIQRDYLTFLIGGGGHEGKTCINLLIDGQVVRTAVGPNTRPGGSEELAPFFWDVQEFRGKTATIQIVDDATGGWGHINVDHLVLSDEKPKLPEYRQLEKTFTIAKKYLIIPIKNGAKQTELALEVDGRAVRQYRTELAISPDDVDWYAFFTIDSYQGKSARVTADRATEAGFALVEQADAVPGSETWYTESLRPQLRFSQAVGWNNDPNGMVYCDGQWHLFLQHNPVGWKWGNMTWGHAVSRDLVHWEQLPNALFPGTMAQGACFSGSAIVDQHNTGGFKTGDQDVIVAFLTDTGAGEALAFSNDRGRTFTWYEQNPVVKHRGRDPKVVWYAYGEKDTPLNEKARELGGHWVMAVYDEQDEYGRNIAFYTSVDLKQWEEQSHLPGYFECPELFELPVDNDPNDTRWVVFAADAQYAVGRFDGRVFTPEHEGKHRVHYGSYYASQTFSNPPDGRRIQIGWARIEMPGMPFNQTFSLPATLTLKTTPEGIRLRVQPVGEIETLRGEARSVEGQKLTPKKPLRFEAGAQLFDILVDVEPKDAKEVVLQFGDNRVKYDVAAATLDEMPLPLANGRLKFRVIVDRPMFEVIGGDGNVYKTARRADGGKAVDAIELTAVGGEAKVESVTVYPMRSIWRK